MTSPRVIVEIATKDRVGELYGCLVSLHAQRFKHWDLVIFDDSKDSVRGAKYINDLLIRMKLEGHSVQYVHNANRAAQKGVCYARNQAALLARGNPKYHLRLDDDSVMDSNFIGYLFNAAEILEIEGKKVGAVGGIVPPLSEPQTGLSVPKIFNEVIFEDHGIRIADDGGYSYDHFSEPVRSHHLRSTFLFTDEAFKATGGHGEHFGSSYAFREETDFCMKMICKGFELFTVPDAVCWHQLSHAGGSRSQQVAQAVQINEEYFQRKWLLLKRQGKLPAGAFTGV